MVKSKIQNPKSKINPNFKIQITKQKFCHLSFVFWYSFVICHLSFVILMSGCATITEGAKGIAGISTKSLEDSRKEAIVKTVNDDYQTAYKKAKEVLVNTGSYIYAEDTKKKMIAIYVTKEDTTPVGIFFKEIEANKTQIEVSSPSTYAKELIAVRLFMILNPEEKKG